MNRKRIRQWMTVPLIGTMLAMNLPMAQPVYAEMSTYDKNRMLGATSMDWQSTSLREWLNSDKMKVDFTSLPPSYENEPGFLSNENFTPSERNAIAVSRHTHGYQGSLSGNTNDTMYYSQRSVANKNYVANDKVFILHYTDLVNYIEKNKLLFERYKKNYSNYLQTQTNKKDKYDFLVNSGYYNGGYVNVSVQYTSGLRQVNARDEQNIVPALSLKPDYMLSSGRRASSLSVGETVTFGKYNGEPIEWEVITKSDDGYPLLWSSRILTVKEYDQEGDINPRTSDFINFPTHEVDFHDGNGQAKSRETQRNIDSTTTVSFPNESVLTTPTNDTSITLQIKATDTKYGIRKMILPDGTVVNGGEAEWTFDKNGEYDILVENEIGVLTVKHFITKAINTPAVVNITTNKDESTKWTNKPVTVNISASNNGVYELLIRGNREMKYGGTSSARFPSWMPLGGKRLHIKGTVRNAMTAEELASVPDAYIRMRGNYTWYNSGQRGMTYPLLKQINLKELYEKGEIVVDEIITMPSNIYEGYYTSINLMDSNTAYMKSPYNYWISDFTYEILDKDDLKIEEITFPDGSKTSSDTASYVITENGSYTFSAKDNRGKVTSKTIQVAVDVVKPTLSISGIESKIVKNQTLRIEGRDGASGVKRIRLPNGEYRNVDQEGQSLTVEYNIIENGEYTFLVEDYAGNTTSQKVSISNVDSTAPVMQETLSKTTWTNQPVTIGFTATDGQSGVKHIVLPNGVIVTGGTATYTVSQNGDYRFLTEDGVGNQTSKVVTVAIIDTALPTGSLSQSPTASVWTKSDVTLSLMSLVDTGGAGVSHVKLPDGTTRSGSSNLTYPAKQNGVYVFTVYDKAGNEKELNYSVQNIDRTLPGLSTKLIPGTNGLTIRFTGNDALGVVESITLPNGQVVAGTTADFVTTKAGVYASSVTDKAGNTAQFTTTIESPVVSIIQEKTGWTSVRDYALVARGTPKYGATLLLSTPLNSQSWIAQNEISAQIQQNGTYTFDVNDGGIRETKTIKVDNFDRANPILTVKNRKDDSGHIIVNIKVEDIGD